MIEIKKEHYIYAEILEDTALEQFRLAMNNDFVVKWALMPDSHTWYSLPIWWVIATKDVIVPAWVGYDIGCGVTALKTEFTKEDLNKPWLKEKIFKDIYKYIPTWTSRNINAEIWDYSNIDRTNIVDEIMNKENWLTALTTLGWWNHFMEIGYDENSNVWIIIHSWSRKIGHSVASYYMLEAKKQNIDVSEIERDFEKKHIDFKEHNYERFVQAKANNTDNMITQLLKGSNLEGHFGFDINSEIGKNYIKDLKFCLLFALENRKRMVERVYKIMDMNINNNIEHDLVNSTLDLDNLAEDIFINRNHNHAELNAEGLWVHRKGATHAENWMYGVIPWNMKDWSFIVKGKWNTNSLSSSSHGAGRILSRKAAMENIDLDDFKDSMTNVIALVNEWTKDESVFAYKNIFDVMNAQKDLVDIVHHVKPLINIKADDSKYC